MIEKQANLIYDIFVEHCGALKDGRDDFVFAMVDGCREYRCCHVFGFGGKFYSDNWIVYGYPEDMNDRRKTIRDGVNKMLEGLKQIT